MCIRDRVMHVDGFEWKEGVVSAYSCRLDGVNVFDLKKLNPGETAEGTIIWFCLLYTSR